MNTATTQPPRPLSSYENQPHESLRPSEDLIEYVKTYARQQPETAALWCFCIGFIVGWKLKPW